MIRIDGKKEAELIVKELVAAKQLKGKKLVIFQADNLEAESTYVRLKREMGERLGVAVEIKKPRTVEELKQELEAENVSEDRRGILVQLPIFDLSREVTDQILSTIAPERDIDGLNPKSEFIPAVVMAVEIIMERINFSRELAVAVVGAKGMVGVRLIDRLSELGFVVSGFDKGDDLAGLKEFDVVVAVTGEADLIRPEMVKEGFAGIDLGFPKPEFSAEAVAKAAVITPVPGGVGPLTIVSLFENLAQMD